MNEQAISRRSIRKALHTNEKLLRFWRRNQGLTILEYAVAAGLIVAAVAGAFFLLGTSINAIIATVIAFL